MPNATAFPLNRDSQAAFMAYYGELQDTSKDVMQRQRERCKTADLSYQREQDKTDTNNQAKAQHASGNPNVFRNITVPVVMPQVESAVAYQSSVFLQSDPIFGVVADPTQMDAALQMETKIEDDSIRGGWKKELIHFFRNGFKYNFAPIEVDWGKEKTVSVVTDATFSTEEGKPEDVIWAGNKLKSLDPYNTFLDPRVPPSEVYRKGEWAGYTDQISRIQLKQYIAELSDTIVQNVTKAFNSSNRNNPGTGDTTTEDYYIPDINPEINVSDHYEGETNWDSWAGIASDKPNNIEYKDSYQITVLYCKILPSEFGLNVPGRNTPQVWKLIIINHEIIIHAERLTNAHGWIPILVGQPNEDNLGYQAKSLAKNSEDFQQITTTFMNSILASRRRAISDRTLYDPSRIMSAHINSENPSAKIPVRPSAYGKDISQAVYQFPYREDQGVFSMQQIRELISMSNMLIGQNPARQGQFVKGNKTREEYVDVQSNATGRDQLASILLEAQTFMPLKHILKINILQYEGSETIYSRSQQKAVEIDPVQLRKAVLEFRISDGLIPSDKIIDGTSWSVAMQAIGSNPQIGAGYDFNGMFSYLMKVKGADLKPFEKSKEQLAYEQALGAWQGAMNLAIEKGIDPEKLGIKSEMPKPEDFGYTPAGQQGTTIEGESQTIEE